jgi:glycerol-3-phosphate acyltransferase PlsX
MKVAERRPDVRLLLYGKVDEVRQILEKYPKVAAVSELIHCEIAVRMDDKPSQALRHGRWKSSMWKAIEAVKAGQADCCISAGNTGALMAMSKFCLRTMATIDRPAIASIWPTLRGESIVLDVGATIGADAHQLIDFAILGAAMSRALFGINRPTVGLLNVGVEEIKGQEEVKEAGQLLREAGQMSMSYHGFVEGDDLGKGTVDVFVTEGFAGNIAFLCPRGVRPVAREARCTQGERRCFPGSERHRGEKPRRHRRRGLCSRGRARLRHDQERAAGQNRG